MSAPSRAFADRLIISLARVASALSLAACSDSPPCNEDDRDFATTATVSGGAFDVPITGER